MLFDMSVLQNYIKKLCVLVVINTVFSVSVFAIGEFEQPDKHESNNWIMGLKNQTNSYVFEEMKKLYKANVDEQEYEEVFNPRPTLQIFVSRSMPLPLLKSYARSAEKYNAVLTFRGLPQGQLQFQKLTELVSEINGEDGKCAMNIDDESFEIYGIDTVPAIVLSENLGANNLLEKKAPLYDKVVGSVKLEYALELFASEGSLSEEATSIIEGANDR